MYNISELVRENPWRSNFISSIKTEKLAYRWRLKVNSCIFAIL